MHLYPLLLQYRIKIAKYSLKTLDFKYTIAYAESRLKTQRNKWLKNLKSLMKAAINTNTAL